MAVTDYTTKRLNINAGGSDTCALAADELAPLINNSTDPRNFSVYGDSTGGAAVDRAPTQGQDMEGNGALKAKITREHKDIGTAPRPAGVVNADTNPLDDGSNVRPPTDVTSQVRGPGIETDAGQAPSSGYESLLTPKETTLSSSKKDGAKSATRARNGSSKKRGRKTAHTDCNKPFIRTAGACEEALGRAASPAYEEKAIDDTYTAVEKAEEAVRKRKGKGKEVELPNSESASTGSKRRRNEEITIDDISEVPLGPGPSLPTARRIRTRLEASNGTGEPAQPARRSTRIPALVAKGKIKTPPIVRRKRQVACKSVEQASAADKKRKHDALTDEESDSAPEAPQMRKKHRHDLKETERSPEGQGQNVEDPSPNELSQSRVVSPVDAIRVKLSDHEKHIRVSAIRYTLRFRRWTAPLEDVIEIKGIASTSDVPDSHGLNNTRSESRGSPSDDVEINGTVPTSPGIRRASPSSDDEVERLLLVQEDRESTPTAGSPGPSTLPGSTAIIPEDAVVIDLTGDAPVELTRPRQKVRRGPRGGQWKCQWPQNNAGWYHSPPPDETGRQRLAPEPSDGLVEAMRNGWMYGCRSPAYSRYTKYKIW